MINLFLLSTSFFYIVYQFDVKSISYFGATAYIPRKFILGLAPFVQTYFYYNLIMFSNLSSRYNDIRKSFFHQICKEIKMKPSDEFIDMLDYPTLLSWSFIRSKQSKSKFIRTINNIIIWFLSLFVILGLPLLIYYFMWISFESIHNIILLFVYIIVGCLLIFVIIDFILSAIQSDLKAN